ncbi:hypothetical protein DHB64_13825 [Antarcticibacterium sp. W02-3]|nr:hypothetical protein [Antarcticibacterium sp. W02-3]
MKPALSNSGMAEVQSLDVKGRQGLLINQKLSFGEFQTSKVKRSWTRGREGGFGVPVGAGGRDILSYTTIEKAQTFSFQMEDIHGNRAIVYAISEFAAEELQLNKNLGGLVEDFFGVTLSGNNIFYLQLFINNEFQPWELILNNEAAQVFAKEYKGLFAASEEQYYVLKPITKIEGKKGPQNLIMGSIGYEIFNKNEEPVAAVSLVDAGRVFFHTTDPSERFLLANLCAALLLQEDIAE